MKWSNSILPLFFALVATSSFAQEGDWATYQSEKWNFKTDFPGAPTESSEAVPSALGELAMDIAMLEGEESVLMTNVTSYPKELMEQVSNGGMDVFFKGMINGAAGSIGGEVISTENIKYQDYEGREVKINAFDGEVLVTMRFYAVGNAVYTLQAMYPVDGVDEASMEKFFSSFELTEK